MENKTLMTDFYELTMAATYFDMQKQNEQVYFNIFFRKNPFEGGYTLSGNLDEIIKYIQNFKFSVEEINYLKSLKTFKPEFLNYLADLKFKGDIYAVPDGTMVFPNEPVITVKADMITAQLLETYLLAEFNHGALITTAAKRITNEAKKDGKNIPVMEFGLRRSKGALSGLEASKLAYIGGCAGTSNTYAGMKYGIPVLGTMAHSLIMDYENEYEAFLSYAKSNPDNCVFLVDTYDTLRSGIPNAIKVANDFLKPNGYQFKGIRIDSGDLAYLSKEARKMLDEAGYPETTICLSNGLDEYSIRDLLNEGAVIDSLGVGDNLAAPNDRVGGVYKLAATVKNNQIVPKIKISEDNLKTTNPGFKKIYRFYDKKTGYALGDVIALNYEKINANKFTLVHPEQSWKQKTIKDYEVRELLVPIFLNGNLVYQEPTLIEKQKYCEAEYQSFYPEIRRIYNPYEYYVDLTEELCNLKSELINEYKGKSLVKTKK